MPKQKLSSEKKDETLDSSSPNSTNAPVSGLPLSPEIGYASSERAKMWGKEFLSNPNNFPCRVTMIVNPNNPKDECVLVLPDAYKPELQYSDYIKTHKVVKQQTASCVQ